MSKHGEFKRNSKQNNLSKVIRFGSELFCPLIPPPATLNTTTEAINPRDVVLNRPPLLTGTLSSINDNFFQVQTNTTTRERDMPLGSAITIGPAGYIETVRSPYSNYSDDVFFDVSSFSIPSNSSDSNYGNECIQNYLEVPILNSGSKILTNEDEETHSVCTLPPSSAILQSQLDNSSLDYFISNNSFIEEIKSSLSVEQQQYINSGMTNSSSSNQCTTTSPSFTTVSYDIITRTYSDSLNFHLTLYDDIFENNASEDDESDHCFSILISPTSDYISLGEDDDDNATVKSTESTEEEIQNTYNLKISRLQSLLEDLSNYNQQNNNSNDLEEIKNKYILEINDAFVYNKKEDSEGLKKLYTAIIKSYKKANTSSKKKTMIADSLKSDNSQTDQKTRKRKCSSNSPDERSHPKKKTFKKVNMTATEEEPTMNEVIKKSRKNYNSDTIDTLMNWYLVNDGKPPTNESKQSLAKLTGKSNIQISTWFQNARRRYQKKLEKFKSSKLMYPTLVYDYQSFKQFLKANRL